MIDNSNTEKTTRAIFPGKFIFAQIWTKRDQIDPKLGFFRFLEKLCHASFNWKYSKMKTIIVNDISPTYLEKF